MITYKCIHASIYSLFDRSYFTSFIASAITNRMLHAHYPLMSCIRASQQLIFPLRSQSRVLIPGASAQMCIRARPIYNPRITRDRNFPHPTILLRARTHTHTHVQEFHHVFVRSALSSLSCPPCVPFAPAIFSPLPAPHREYRPSRTSAATATAARS